MTLIDDIANHLADMPAATLPIYRMLFPPDIVNCIAIFPSGGGVGGNIGVGPLHYDSTGAIDYPGFQVQVRYTDPYNAYYLAEEIRKWLDQNPPTGYVICTTRRSQPDDLTNANDLSMAGGPAYRWSVDFGMLKVRA